MSRSRFQEALDTIEREFEEALTGAGDDARAVEAVRVRFLGRKGSLTGLMRELRELPADDPVSPADVAATIYRCLGIDSETEYRTSRGRPVRILKDGRAIDGILA